MPDGECGIWPQKRRWAYWNNDECRLCIDKQWRWISYHLDTQLVFYQNIVLNKNEMALDCILARPSRRCLWVQCHLKTSPEEETETSLLILAYLSLVAPGA
jgi:hypothetical protein